MLKLQYFGHLIWRANSSEKTLMLGKIEGRREGGDRRRDGWMASLTQWTWVWTSSRDGERQRSLACCCPQGCKESGMTKWLNIDSISISSDCNECACNTGDPSLIPGFGRSPGEGNGNPLQYSCLESSMDRGAWSAIAHRFRHNWVRHDWVTNMHTHVHAHTQAHLN